VDHVIGIEIINVHDIHAPRALVESTTTKRREILLEILLVLAVWGDNRRPYTTSTLFFASWGVKQVIADFEMGGEAYRQGFIHYHAGEIAQHMEQMAIGPDASDYGPSDDEGEAYRQDFIHYHVGEIAEHMEQMAIGPEASDYGPSDDENQRSDRSNGAAMCNRAEGQSSDENNVSQQRSDGAAMCNRAEGQSSDENNVSQQHSEYSSADECGRSERSIESCSSDSGGRRSATLSPAAATAAAGVSATLSPAAATTAWNGEGEGAETVDI